MNIHPDYSSQTFGCKLNTISVIESATGKLLKNGNDNERLKLIKDVLELKERDLETLKENPMSGFLCLISSGKILLNKNPRFAQIINNITQIIENDKHGETTNEVVQKIVRKYGEEIDLRV